MNVYPSLASRLRTQQEAIANILSAIGPEALHLRPAPDKWTVHEHIAHLARYQNVFAQRIRQIVADKGAAISVYSADTDPEFALWCSIDTATVLRQLAFDRSLLVKQLKQLNYEQWQYTGVHERLGPLRLVDWAEFFVLHEAHHLLAIFKTGRQGIGSIL